MRRLSVILLMVTLAAATNSAETTKSKSQSNREKGWGEKVKSRKLSTGEPLHSLTFGGLTMGCTKADAQKFMSAGPGKVEPGKETLSLYDKEVLSYIGHPKLSRIRVTDLSFFQGRLMRIVVRMETPDANLTFEAMTGLLEAKYGDFPAKEKEKGSRNLSLEKDPIVVTLNIQRGPKGDEVVVVVRDKDMEDSEWETSVEKEKASLGEI